MKMYTMYKYVKNTFKKKRTSFSKFSLLKEKSERPSGIFCRRLAHGPEDQKLWEVNIAIVNPRRRQDEPPVTVTSAVEKNTGNVVVDC